MNCPQCKVTALVATTLEANLISLGCPGCGGNWVQSTHYERWIDSLGGKLPEKDAGENAALEIVDGDRARICPECAVILARCRVGCGLEFYIERCGICGGIWLDRNEWSALKSRNLHDDAHRVFSKVWQDRLLREERAAARERWFADQFGADRLEEIKTFKRWLQAQEHRSAIIAYLGE